jgi:hypothetical protein
MPLNQQAIAYAHKKMKEHFQKYNNSLDGGPDISELHRKFYKEELQRLKAAESKEAA